jgi:hypothetical protein
VNAVGVPTTTTEALVALPIVLPMLGAALAVVLGRWRVVQRTLRSLRAAVESLRTANPTLMLLAFGGSVLHVCFKVATLPMLVFASVRMGVNPEINALASILLLVGGVIGLIAWWFMARTEKQRLKEIRKAAGG